METIPEGNTSTNLGIDHETLAYIEERAQNIIRYSDKLSQTIRILDNYCAKIGEQTGLKFTDSEVFYTEYREPWGKISYRLRIGKEWGLYAANDIEDMDNDCLTDVSRAIKKEAIKRFPAFLKKYAEALQNLSVEYEDIAKKSDELIKIFSD